MTEAEALAWARAATWKFVRYYKYRFTFAATDGTLRGECSAGGDSGDIYRYQVEDPMTWNEICGGGDADLTLTDPGGNVVYSG